MPNEMDMAFILMFLSGATLFDFKKKRIPNSYVLAGLVLTLIRAVAVRGVIGIGEWLIGFIFPILILFVLFASANVI